MSDYLMHYLLRYYESPGCRMEKTIHALKTIGASILIAGMSTLLGTLPLAFSASEIFITIFYAFLALVVLGCGHGLILLPVILSMIGPEDHIEVPSLSEENRSNEASSFQQSPAQRETA